MQRHPYAPHVLYGPSPRGGFYMADERTGETFWAPDEHGLNQFAADRAAEAGYFGAGDLVAAVAKPVARAVGMDERDCGCAGRQAALNQAFPRLLRR